ncbi:MAG: YhcN/YlaJ family sporulation lipoprotein [Syntrophomonadaceae bacterium]|nr:YhcN/YlaJ family sporulation lipoprotein [Syntrophomonadaceae bacterium]
MNAARRNLLIFMIVLTGVCLVASGCRSQTPAKPEAGTPKEVAGLVENEAVKVDGVSQAKALVADKTIYIGLELTGNQDERQTSAIEQSVLDRMTYLEPNYNIAVTSDMILVGKIKEVAAGFAQGNRLSNYSNEIMQLDQGIKLKKEAVDPNLAPSTAH